MASAAVVELHKGLAKALRPPEKLSYSQWAAANFRLSGNTAAPGRFRPWKPQQQILDAIGDPLIERVSIIKSARTGFTTSLVASIGAISINDPCPIILLMPTDDDARGIIVDEIDPAFRDTPALRGIMRIGRFDGRNTLTQRAMLGGGSLKVLSARAPRNLRRHTTKILMCDEVDGMEITSEGDPIALGEKRTISYPDRKIVIGSTPTDEATSIILPKYNESDQRVFKVPCPNCTEPFEMLWEHIDWKRGRPETAVCVCPSCGGTIDERQKPQMVEEGGFEATAPQVKGHAGFRMNALISLFANASWPKLIEEFEKAERAGPSEMQVFVNTVLGKAWSAAINYVNEHQLLARCESFGIAWEMDHQSWREDIPDDVAYVTCGVDVQVDRLECVMIGWSPHHRWLLGKHKIYGSTNLDTTWSELDTFLATRWKHPLGGTIGIEAAGVDSGDGNRTQQVYDYCERVQGRKIVAIKGDGGARPVIQVSKTKRRNRTAPLYIIGVDQVKTDILVTLPLEKTAEQSFRLSNTLDEEFFLQLTAERRELKYKAGRPEIVFVRIGGRRAEALDSTVYAIAVRNLCRFDYETRYCELKGEPIARLSLKERVSKLHG